MFILFGCDGVSEQSDGLKSQKENEKMMRNKKKAPSYVQRWDQLKCHRNAIDADWFIHEVLDHNYAIDPKSLDGIGRIRQANRWMISVTDLMSSVPSIPTDCIRLNDHRFESAQSWRSNDAIKRVQLIKASNQIVQSIKWKFWTTGTRLISTAKQ